MRPSQQAGAWVVAVTLCVAGPSLAGPTLAAQRSDDGDRPYWSTNLFKRVFTDQKFLLTRWWPQEVVKDRWFASTLAVGGALVVQSGSREGGGRDLRWESGISGSAGTSAQSASHVLTRLGNGPAVCALFGTTYPSSQLAEHAPLSEATGHAS